MTERRRPTRRGRGPRPQNHTPTDPSTDSSPYREDTPTSAPPPSGEALNGGESTQAPASSVDNGNPGNAGTAENTGNAGNGGSVTSGNGGNGTNGGHSAHGRRRGREGKDQRDGRFGANGRRGRRGRGRNSGGQRSEQNSGPAPVVVADGTVEGWFDSARDGGFIRRAADSYLPVPGDPFVPPQLTRQFALRRGDLVRATVGRDHRGRTTAVEIEQVNGAEPASATRRPDFSSLIASYPERKLVLETGKPAKGGPELTRRAIDLIAPIGYGQRALIVAPARAGKTMLLQAITEGIAINHPEAVLLVLLVDERPEEVSEMISWGRGEVVASSFDQPAERHVDVADMVLERARRLVESGRDVVIVLDSLTRLARAHNTVERGTGRTLSGGLDATAMAKPKAFFGSARSVAPEHGGGSLTIIATALVETGSRMDDVIFEEFKGTGNCEIKLDRSLAEKRIYPAIDVATSGTRREDKLFKPEQLDAVFTLRRGLQQMPPQSAMEWLIKRIGSTPNNDALLEGL
jgi:Transcription termination factor